MKDLMDAVREMNGGNRILAVAYVPIQRADFSETFPIDEALCKGTIFPELYMPFCRERGAK